MKESVLRTKSFNFAFRVLNLYKHLQNEHREFVISKQVVPSGTSIGANIEEAKHGQSTIDFIHKLSIAQKEAAETSYWLKLLARGDYINEKLAESLLVDCEEIQKLLTASIKTSKLKLGKDEK
ncbi:MAG: four helix bundle protein [Pyrinomonadaceae bacterium]